MNQRLKISFDSHGHQLAGVLERPNDHTHIRGYVLFAHCFTCGKDSVASARISRELVHLGYAVFRFDFSGVGSSEGCFSDTNFSTKVQDLVAAADFLREQYSAPSILVGHSLGGRAVISAAHKIAEVKAVATIAAPADPIHVVKQFLPYADEINHHGEALVPLAGGRTFIIKRQFLENLALQNTDVEQLGKPLLIFHSPTDSMVPITEAEKLYKRAKHPKSFVSLDQADHLLTSKGDALFVATMVAAWSSRYGIVSHQQQWETS